ncbi:hypothetical protein B0H14DRAFT_3638027 [Mycena olivaceomarginata]|nr:hypothetical protein B0H14DRAFT_3638027 [Mycena olivaceomarginata]
MLPTIYFRNSGSATWPAQLDNIFCIQLGLLTAGKAGSDSVRICRVRRSIQLIRTLIPLLCTDFQGLLGTFSFSNVLSHVRRTNPQDEKYLDPAKVSLPSIFTTFEDSYRPERRASPPSLHSESRVRHAPYPPTHLLQNKYAPSPLSSYTFDASHIQSSGQLNSYNVAQLQYALGVDKDISFLNTLSPDPKATLKVPDIDYDSRRMSNSAASADTESSTLSRVEKRALTPNESPQPKNIRSLDQNNWEVDWAESTNPQDEKYLDPAKVSLPSIFTTFDDSYRPERRASPPSLHSESRVRHAPYPPTHLLQNNYAPSSLSSYTFSSNSGVFQHRGASFGPGSAERGGGSRSSQRPRPYPSPNVSAHMRSSDGSGLSGSTPSQGVNNRDTIIHRLDKLFQDKKGSYVKFLARRSTSAQQLLDLLQDAFQGSNKALGRSKAPPPMLSLAEKRSFGVNSFTPTFFHSLILDVALGLRYLHDKDVVHGDLKARAQGGTIRYQAPELHRGGHNDLRSDIYAFACVAYQLLTGKPPFPELRTDGAVIQAVLEGLRPPQPPSCSGTPPLDGVWILLQDCWTGLPERRPTAVQIVERLVGPVIRAKIVQSAIDWDDTFTSRFRRSFLGQPTLPSVAELEHMIFGDGLFTSAVREKFIGSWGISADSPVEGGWGVASEWESATRIGPWRTTTTRAPGAAAGATPAPTRRATSPGVIVLEESGDSIDGHHVIASSGVDARKVFVLQRQEPESERAAIKAKKPAATKAKAAAPKKVAKSAAPKTKKTAAM